MDTYTALRSFADSWGLLAMAIVFLAIVVWAFRPGSRELHERLAAMPLNEHDAPLPDDVDGAASRKSAQEVRT